MSPAELLYYALWPQMVNAEKRLKSDSVRLVHYTSGESALKIIQKREFWLRNVRCMNDFMEVDHGRELLLRIFHADNSARRDRLLNVLDGFVPGGASAAIASFDQWINRLRGDTFIGCLSEHDETRDVHGRLSMWRAYASASGVAIVMNKTPFIVQTDELKAYSAPATYTRDHEFAEQIDKSLDEIERAGAQPVCALRPL